MSKLFQIYEDDLAELERILPEFAWGMAPPQLDNKGRVQLRRIQQIISNVRWNYGPPSAMEEIPADGQAS